MLNKYIYKDKKRYGYEEKKKIIMTFKKQEEKLGKLYKVNEKYENWKKKISGKVWWKSKDRNALVRHMLNNNYAYKKEKILKKIRRLIDNFYRVV